MFYSDICKQLPLWATTEIYVRISNFSGSSVETKASAMLSPLTTRFLFIRVRPFGLSLSSHEDSKPCNSTFCSIYAVVSYSSLYNCFHLHMQNRRHSPLFCMLHWTFAFCLAPVGVKSFTFFHSLPLKLLLLYSTLDVPSAPCVSVWMCCIFSFFCVFRLCALCRMQQESSQKLQPWRCRYIKKN